MAANRSEESHCAGGIVLNAADGSARFSHGFDIFPELAEEVTRVADERPDLPIGVAFVDPAGKAGWIGYDATLRPHAPSVRGCWPTAHGLEP